MLTGDRVLSAVAQCIKWHAMANPREEFGDKVPYSIHPVRVASRVREWGADDEMVIAALFHDIWEDTDVNIDGIWNEYGPEVSHLVFWLTDLAITGKREFRRSLQHEKYIHAPIYALVIKIADVIDNLITLKDNQKEFYIRIRRAEVLGLWGMAATRLEEDDGELATILYRKIYNDFWKCFLMADLRFGIIEQEEYKRKREETLLKEEE